MVPITNGKNLIYGTGNFAKELIRQSNRENIVGILDQFEVDGDLLGCPILSFEDIEDGTADNVIIAASKNYIREIYFRIVHRCNVLNLNIFDYDGKNLRERYQMDFPWVENHKYFCKTAQQLRTLIQQYDVISFDVFDTLIMRKVLYPLDVFEFMEQQVANKYDINILDFKKKRRNAEILSHGGNIETIYDILAKEYGWDENTRKKIMEEEIQCEKKFIVQRRTMVEILEWAISIGKRVFLVSDMYLGECILGDILASVDIRHYEKLIVSCDYGISKEDGLFEILRDFTGECRCLHIGDNHYADVEKAKEFSLDAYEIASATEMLSMSSICKVLENTHTLSDRLYLGNFIEQLFNDPFAMTATYGVLRIQELRLFHFMTFIPIVMVYMRALFACVKRKKCRGILFSARDCYLMKRLYDEKCWDFEDSDEVEAFYFPCSRRLAVKSSITSETDLEEFVRYFSLEVAFLWKTAKNMFGDVIDCCWEELSNDEVKDLLFQHKEEIFRESKKMRTRYLEFLYRQGITGDELFCELSSHGTIHAALNKIFQSKLFGFYLQWIHGKQAEQHKLLYETVYKESDMIGEALPLLELVFTSLMPSVQWISDDGAIIYAPEVRTKQEIDFVRSSHEIIVEEIKKLHSFYGMLPKISKEFAEALFMMYRNVIYEGETDIINRLTLYNDLGEDWIPIFGKRDKSETS